MENFKRKNRYTAPAIRCCDECGISNKDARVCWNTKAQKYLCDKHRAQYEKYGKAVTTHHEKNKVVDRGEYVELILRDINFKETGRALIDKEDYDRCSSYVWTLTTSKKNKKGYVSSKERITRKMIRLHRFILAYDGPLEIDHINQNPLDNRKQNLRIVDRLINSANMPGKGVTKWKNKYVARLQRNNIVYRLGYFDSEEEALNIVNNAKQEYDENPINFEQKYKQKSHQKQKGV